MAKDKKKAHKGIVLIKKSNNLVESKYKFDIWETRFFLSVLAQIRREDTDLHVYRIRYKDIIKIFGLKSGDSYAFLREAAKILMNKSVQINYEENGVKRTKEVHLINSIDYLTEGQKDMKNIGNHEYIDVTVEQEMKPFLLQLSKNFTAYDLRNITKLSVYSIRLYELLKQYEAIGTRTLSIYEMKSMFQVEEQYKLYSDFYRWVIKPSEAEINKHTDLLISDIEKLKEGRKVVALRFKFRAKTEQELSKIRGNPFQDTLFDRLPEPAIMDITEEITEQVQVVFDPKKGIKDKKKADAELLEEPFNAAQTSESSEQDTLIMELSPVVVKQFGVSLKVFMSLVEKHTEAEIRQALKVTGKAIEQGKVENIAGFFVQAVRGHYADVKEQKKQIITDRKNKIVEESRGEEAIKKLKMAAKQAAFEQEMRIFDQIIAAEPAIKQKLIDKIRMGIFAVYYKIDQSFEENLQNPLVKAALLNVAKELKPKAFQEQ